MPWPALQDPRLSPNAGIVVPGSAHHVTQRGIRRSAIFCDSDDRDRDTEVIGRNCEKSGVQIFAWWWMTNPVHRGAVPGKSNSLALALRLAHSTYARRFNARYRFSGHLWQNRFYSGPLDESHTWATTRYVERNPVRAGMVPRGEDYQRSSDGAHCSGQADALISAEGELPPMKGIGSLDRRRGRWSDDAVDPGQHDKGLSLGSGRFRQTTGIRIRQSLAAKTTGPRPGQSGRSTTRTRRS